MRPRDRLDSPPSKSGIGSLSAGAEAAGGGGGRGNNRSRRTRRATRHVGSAALVIFPAESTGHSTERR